MNGRFVFLFNEFRFDRDAGKLFSVDQTGASAPVAIGTRARAILGLLVERPNELISKSEIIEAVWGRSVVAGSNLTVQIQALRRILDRGGAGDSCIDTISGRGYRFIATVTRPEAADLRMLASPSNDSAKVERAPPLAPMTGRRAEAEQPALSIGLSTAVPRLSIVTLPFINLSRDPEQQYFADGITDDLTTELSRIPGMLVISCNTAFTYRNRAIDTKQIGRELGVRYVLEGSCRRSGDQIRVAAQLIDAETDWHLWADRFDGSRGDLFTVQDEITSRIAVALSTELVRAEVRRPFDHHDALDYILRGRAALSKRPTRENYVDAIGLFERALMLGPGSVDAQGWLAMALADRVIVNMTDTADADLARAEELIGRTLAASPSSQQAHFARGQLLRWRRQFEQAISEYEIVLTLNRNSVNALAALTGCYLYNGEIERVIPALEEVFRLSPRDPHIGHWYDRMGLVNLLQSRITEAIIWLEKAQTASPRSPNTHAHLAAAYALAGQRDRAAAEIAQARKLSPDDRFSSIARLQAVVGHARASKVRELFEATYFVGLREAGLPE